MVAGTEYIVASVLTPLEAKGPVKRQLCDIWKL